MVYLTREVDHNKHKPLCLTVKDFSHPLLFVLVKDLAEPELQGLFMKVAIHEKKGDFTLLFFNISPKCPVFSWYLFNYLF